MSNCDISKYIAIPFRNGGRDFRGCDCGGLLRLFYQTELCIDLPDFGVSCLDSFTINTIVDHLKPSWKKINWPQPVCVALMRTSDSDPLLCDHFGIVYAPGMMIHTNRKTGCIKTKLDHPFWSKTIEGFYAFAG